MSSFPGGHAGFLVAALATHALVGYALGRVVEAPIAGVVGGLAADLDLLVPPSLGWPLAHRGITHTPAAAVVTVLAVYGLTRRLDISAAVGLGYASQLLIDLTTAQGIPLAYPLSRAFVAVPLGTHGPIGTALIWVAVGVALWLSRSGVSIDTPVR